MTDSQTEHNYGAPCPHTDEQGNPIPCSEAERRAAAPLRIIVDYGLPGYGPDAADDHFSVCATWPDVADELRRRLDESAEGVMLYADSLAEAGQYEEAWKTRKHADDMWLLHDTLDNARADAPAYRAVDGAWDATIEKIVADRFPFDVDPGCRIYVFESDEFGADEDQEDA